MSADKLQLLVDTITFQAQILESDQKSGGKLIVRGEFARGDLATENKRVYPKTLWEREMKRLDKQLKEKKVYGELDHPMDGRTQLKRASHILTGLTMQGDVVVGECEILNTTEGKNLKAIIEAGGAVGVSSRGFGTTRPGKMGEDIVQDDYRLMTFDFVAEPANMTSYPKVYRESDDSTAPEAVMAESISELTKEALKESNPAVYESIVTDAELEYEAKAAKIWAAKIMAAKDEAKAEVKADTAAELRGTFSENLTAALEKMRAEVTDAVRAELLADPAVAGAKTALESVKALLRPYVIPGDVEAVVQEREAEIVTLKSRLAESEQKLADLNEQNEQLAGLAKEAGYRFHVEKLLNGVDTDHGNLIRKLVGDVTRYESISEIDEKITAIVEEVESVEARNEERKSERDKEITRLRAENNQLKEATEMALHAGKLKTVQAYAEKRLANHPMKKTLRAMIEESEVSSKEEVDQIMEAAREKRRDPDDLASARARVREYVGSQGRESLIESEERPARKGAETKTYNGIDVSVNDLRVLSGIGGDN